MNLTKNQVMIIAVLIVAVLAYFMFFRKPKAKPSEKSVKDAKDAAVNAAVVASQAAATAKEAAKKAEEASYDGLPEQGITQYPYSDAMASVSMIGGADKMSSYDGLSAAPTQQELAGIMGTFSTDWLDIKK